MSSMTSDADLLLVGFDASTSTPNYAPAPYLPNDVSNPEIIAALREHKICSIPSSLKASRIFGACCGGGSVVKLLAEGCSLWCNHSARGASVVDGLARMGACLDEQTSKDRIGLSVEC